jgi:hypothetical protein
LRAKFETAGKSLMYSYFLFGLEVKSDIELPARTGSDDAPGDLFFRLQPDALPPPPGAEGRIWYVDIRNTETIFFVHDVGTFVIRDGKEIFIHPLPEASVGNLRVFLIGSALAFLMHQRGALVLHASSIKFADGAALFLGESGFGKSSIAAAMYMKGYSLVTDDLSPVRIESDTVWIAPGFPKLKLYPEIAAALGIDPATMDKLERVEKKMAHKVVDRFATERLPVRCIFVLDKAAPAEISPAPPRETVMQLVKHSYPTRLSKGGGAPHFLKCSEVAKRVPIMRLRSFSYLSDIRSVTETIERQLLELAGQAPAYGNNTTSC